MPAPTLTQRILLVDDDSQVRQALHRKLSACQLDAAECPDGQQALDALRREKYDAVLLDLKMPHVDGYGVLSQLGGTPNAETPVYVLTAMPNDLASERARELGARRVLNKHELSPQAVVDLVCRELRPAAGSCAA